MKNKFDMWEEEEKETEFTPSYTRLKISIFDDDAGFFAHLMALMCQNEEKTKKKWKTENNKQKQQNVLSLVSQNNMLLLNMQNFAFSAVVALVFAFLYTFFSVLMQF